MARDASAGGGLATSALGRFRLHTRRPKDSLHIQRKAIRSDHRGAAVEADYVVCAVNRVNLSTSLASSSSPWRRATTSGRRTSIS